MVSFLQKPVFIAAIITVLSIATLLLINHTRLIVDPQTPPGTTFNAAKDAGAAVTKTIPESPIKPKPPGPEPVNPAVPTK